MVSDASSNRIAGLETLLRAQGVKGPAPVEKWNPPYCGDIGMKIRADGVWIYGGTPIGRMPLVKLFGEQGIVDLIGVSGYYTFNAMMMNVARSKVDIDKVPPLQKFPE